MTDITNFSGQYRWLSNFYISDLCVLGIPYLSSEAAYQASKSLDISVRRKFSGLDPSQAKKLGRKIGLRPDWFDGITKIESMELCLRAKFVRPILKLKLIDTGSVDLIEGNTWGDTYWGVCNGKGSNILGKLLMEIRSDFQRWEEEDYHVSSG